LGGGVGLSADAAGDRLEPGSGAKPVENPKGVRGWEVFEDGVPHRRDEGLRDDNGGGGGTGDVEIDHIEVPEKAGRSGNFGEVQGDILEEGVKE
jgi:hypothetical protein